MKIHYIKKKFNKYTLLCMVVVLSISSTIPASAVSDFFSDSNIQLYDPNACDPSGQDNSVKQENKLVEPGKIYILGDSITEIAKDKYIAKFNGVGWNSTVEGLGSRHISSDIPSPSGLKQIVKDRDTIKDAKVIVIALGTNDQGYLEEEMEKQVEKVLKEINKINSTAKTYWVNIMDSRSLSKSKEINKAIAAGATDRAEVIDWYSKSKKNDLYKRLEMGVHPENKGGNDDIQTLVNFVYQAVSDGAAPDEPGDEGESSAPDGGSAEGSESSDASNTSADTFEGHRLPAVRGGTGYEDPVGPDGILTDGDVGGKITFPQHVGLGTEYQDYYITMRWPYVKWSWNGGSTDVDSDELNWYSKKPRKLVVTNSRTNKSIIAVAAESGPRPWAGAKGGRDNSKNNGYSTPQRYTPKNYTGRVSGLPPKAYKAIGAKQTENGRGDTLYYAWAPDQTAKPGPTNLKATGDGIQGDAGETEGRAACCPTDTPSGGAGNFDGKENVEKALNFFISQGFSKEQAAGIVGNFIQESGVNPKSVERGWGFPKESDTVPPASGPQGQPGYGIAQWTSPGRKNGLKNFGSKPGEAMNTLETQLKWVMEEMKNYPGLEDKLKNVKGSGKSAVEQSALLFHKIYEGSADNASQIQERVNSGWLAIKGFTPTGVSSEDVSTQGVNICVCGDTIASDISTGSTDLQGILKDLAANNDGDTAISVSTIDGKIKANTRGDTQKETRSSYKLYVAYGILYAIEEGKLSWDKKISGSTIESHMQKMIVNSDNDSAAILRNRSEFGGPSGLTSILQNKVGLSGKTVMGTGASGAEDERTKSTTNDYAKFLILLNKEKLPGVTNKAYYNKLIGYMKQAKTDSGRSGIAAGVGDDEVADKPGWSPNNGPDDGPASNDVGIVYTKGQPYVIAFLTSNPNPSGFTKIAKMTESIHNVISKGGSASNSCAGVTGDLPSIVKSYAWPDYHPAPYLKRRPAWAKVADDPKSHYVGGMVSGVKGIDCGGFTTMTIRNAGIDTSFNPKKGDTIAQMEYAEKNWKKISVGSTSDLRAGDVAISSSHTFLYVGEIDGFNQKFASASYSKSGNGRAPMADTGGQALGHGFNWYRKK